MFPKEDIVCTSQPNTNILPIDPTPLLENGNSPTAIIIAVAFLLWVLRPVLLVMLKSQRKK
ncbi:MAG: hypothetical protein F6K17_35285 [Okeania sp. SIO3C4]|nr:hypothetical protein [Okeania sp. SIO3B3]NER07461.1 hypothetical protein [Okeania sp. SIO3C4]